MYAFHCILDSLTRFNFCRQQVYQELHGQREEKNQIYQYLEASCIIINYNNYINTSILTQG